MKDLLRQALLFISSLKLTIICLSAAMLLVFAGTMAQVQYGIQIVQEHYFQSVFVWWPPNDTGGLRIPVFPGGHLIGGVLLLNLVAAHIRRFRWTLSKAGIQLTHAGLIIMLAGGLLTDVFSVESHMRIEEGQTRAYSEDFSARELAIIDSSDPGFDQVTVIPDDSLVPGRLLSHESLPFNVLVRDFQVNSSLSMIGGGQSGATPAASRGAGARIKMEKLPRVTGPEERDVMSAVIEIIPIPDGKDDLPASLGTWLVSDALADAQTVECGGRKLSISLRLRRHYKPYSLTLLDFTHERYPGTRIPKNFSSLVTLNDPEKGENREVLIYMNHPLRYRGDTFYQSGFERTEDTTVLQVVRNPSVVAPYVACVVVGAGLLLQFSIHLLGFARRRKEAEAS